MRYCRFRHEGCVRYGRVEERDGAFWVVAPIESPEEDLRARLGGLRSFATMALDNAQLLPPVTPSKIVCVGRNYRDHAKELGNEVPAEPLLFLKPPSALIASGGTVRIPKNIGRVDYEGELGVVIGKRLRKLSPDDDWRKYVRGYTLADDISARDLQKSDGQWTRAKGFDSFCPVGPIVSDEIDPDAGVTMETRVNGTVRQQASTRDLIFPLGELLRHISAIMTLEPGDLILTGTPAGVAPLQAGDRVEVSVPGLGTLRHGVDTEE